MIRAKKTIKKKIVGWIVALFVFVSVIILVVILLHGNNVYILNDNKTTATKSLHCDAESVPQPFFNYVGVDTRHDVKYIFDSEENVDKVSYTYKNVFASNEIATHAEAKLHTDYNLYMGKTDVYQEDLSPTFVINNNKLTINLFMDRNTFTQDTAIFVFLTREDFENIYKYKIYDVKKMYENKNFSCIIN